jgi:hypothetical protein
MTFMYSDWYLRRLRDEPPGEILMGGDPMGRFPALPDRLLGTAVWGVYENDRRIAGVRSVSRRAFVKFVILPVILLVAGLLLVLLASLGAV